MKGKIYTAGSDSKFLVLKVRLFSLASFVHIF
jgi:hypothetical protein